MWMKMNGASLLLFLYISSVISEEVVYQHRHRCTNEEALEHPRMCLLMHQAALHPASLSNDMYEWSKEVGLAIDLKHMDKEFATITTKNHLRQSSVSQIARKTKEEFVYPTVLAHGMGDSCFNDGMQGITSKVSELTDNYSTCIPTADNLHDDVMNSYFLNMDASVDVFAEKVKSDPELSNGFNAIGFSQGNNVIRGYIARYNDPPVKTFISVNGVNAGIGALPYCIPKEQVADDKNINDGSIISNAICNALMEAASHKAYSDFSQQHSFQANYWRDPRPEEKENYQTYSQLAQWNNEGKVVNATFNENWSKTNQFVWIMASEDTIVWPREGEQWGAPDPENPFEHILPMKETEWYINDLFGLKTADLAGKNKYEVFEGQHLQFDYSDFERWINTYLE